MRNGKRNRSNRLPCEVAEPLKRHNPIHIQIRVSIKIKANHKVTVLLSGGLISLTRDQDFSKRKQWGGEGEGVIAGHLVL